MPFETPAVQKGEMKCVESWVSRPNECIKLYVHSPALSADGACIG